MDTSFWDDEEDKVKIVYQDDQIPMQVPQEVVAGPGTKRRTEAERGCGTCVGHQVLLVQDEHLTSERGSRKLSCKVCFVEILHDIA